jgi:hypothetical protein
MGGSAGRNAMHVEQSLLDEDPSGLTTWRYQVTDDAGNQWTVEVYGGAHVYTWIVTGETNPDMLTSPQEPHDTADGALDAALTYIRERGTV